MKKKLCFILGVFSFFDIVAQDVFHSINMDWQVTPIFTRNLYGQYPDTSQLELHSYFSGDTSMIIIFDYNDIMEGNSWITKCYNSIDSIIINTHSSQIILESEFGKFVPLSDNIYSPTYIGRMGSPWRRYKSEYNFDVCPIDGRSGGDFIFHKSIPISALKICENNQKVRFHYLYRATKKYSMWSDKNYIISSDWIVINEIH